jgi:ABC-type glycerol-3-phosphate transport system substrate-binding protein
MSRRVVLVGGCTLVPVLAACGASAGSTPSSTSSAPVRKIVVSKATATEEKDGAWRETFALAEQAIRVEAQLVTEPGGAAYWEKRQSEFASGTPNVDVHYNQLNWFLIGGLRGMFVDLLPLFKRDKVDTSQYYQADFRSWMWKGKLWALTFQAGGEAAMYNKALFQEKGAKLPRKDWTYDDLLAACQKLNDPANNRFAIQINQNGLQYMMGTFVRNFGGQVLNEQRNRALYGDDPKALQGAGLDVDLHTKYRYTPSDEALASLPQGMAGRAIEQKMVAIEINGLGRFIDIRKAIGAENLDFAPPPKGPAGIQKVRVAGNSWSVPSQSQHHDAAWQLLKWLHTKQGLISPQLRAISWPPLVWAAQTPQWMDQFKGTHIGDVQNVWRTGGHNQVVVPEGDEALKLMNGPMNRALKGEISTRAALHDSADGVNALFAQRPKEWNYD